MKNFGKMLAIACVALVLIGCQMGLQPTDDYTFRVVGQPSGHAVTVQVVKTATGQPVTDAQLSALHVEHRGLKAQPSVIYSHNPLNADGQGGYVYQNRDVEAGATLTIAAKLAGHDSWIWGTVHVPG